MIMIMIIIMIMIYTVCGSQRLDSLPMHIIITILALYLSL
jgi:hypothetical protein